MVWPALDPDRLDVSFPQWLRASGVVVGRNRTEAARLAQEYLAEIRKSAGVESNVVVPADPIEPAKFATSMRVTGPVAAKQAIAGGLTPSAAMDVAFTRNVGAATRMVIDAGRDTLMKSAAADPECRGWRRVTSGGCEFCRMLEGRGGVYSAETVNFPSHDHCMCSVEPVYDEEPTAATAEEDNLADMSDADIETALAAAWEAGDQVTADRLMALVDEREAAQAAAPTTRAAQYTEASTARWVDEDFDEEIARLIQEGDMIAVDQLAYLMDAREAARKANDLLFAKFAEEAAERAAARKLLDGSPRRRPSTIDQQLRSDYDDYVHVEWLKAEDECSGVLLNKAGLAAGINPTSLWSGSTARARKYASEELKTFWQRSGRINFATFRADALGRQSDRGAREATTREGWYDSVG